VRVKRPGGEADHSPPSSAEVKECVELYLHSPNTSFMALCLVKYRDNFTFYLLPLCHGSVCTKIKGGIYRDGSMGRTGFGWLRIGSSGGLL
jgi:hypothetical protein